MFTALFVATLAVQAHAATTSFETSKRAAVYPAVKGTTLLANVTNPVLSRDSCGSVRMGNRAFWTCRDTEDYNPQTGQSTLPLLANTGGWTAFKSDGTPDLKPGPRGAGSSGANPILQMTGYDANHANPLGKPFYPFFADECPDYGACEGGDRWVGWPDQPPVVTNTAADGTITAYTWVSQQKIRGLTAEIKEPPTALFKLTYKPGSDASALPTVTPINERFWAQGQTPWGTYGSMVKDGMVYLYGRMDQPDETAVARVSVGSVENKNAYQYYNNGAWTSTMPSINSTSAVIKNGGAGGQGTFYYSDHFNSYVWIGAPYISVTSGFYLTTAPAPEGPWVQPYKIYQGTDGDYPGIGAYTLQAHPGLLKSSSQDGIYISWTQQWDSKTYGAYTTPLVYVQWQ
ncbi:Hypothetical protein R9X50_00486000 [Acrodontium crateriforme]|uniref:DUF4185 domain-containing protein n=1 Tax=Acrodontium crateriforme TaxID=150365 RepID=A0AAQ3M8L6_9PEZI|nr:Hypothetical protein R9X50_00486000 [Acrodontium crateriforme]